MFDLSGKKALITGSTQGIGKAIAICFASYGAEVIIHGSERLEKCQKVADEIGKNATIAVADLKDEDCAEELYKYTGNVDILVLNASMQIRKPWNQIIIDDFQKQININYRSSLLLIQKYVPYMQMQKWGRILTIGSVQQYKPHRDMLVYAGSKEAQFSLVINLAKQLACDGITVNNLAPGVIITPRNDTALSDEAYAKQVLAGIPLGFAGEAKDCTGAALLLCSEAGRYITGTDLIVDGGMHL